MLRDNELVRRGTYLIAAFSFLCAGVTVLTPSPQGLIVDEQLGSNVYGAQIGVCTLGKLQSICSVGICGQQQKFYPSDDDATHYVKRHGNQTCLNYEYCTDQFFVACTGQ